jgi:hypothetical protein
MVTVVVVVMLMVMVMDLHASPHHVEGDFHDNCSG